MSLTFEKKLFAILSSPFSVVAHSSGRHKTFSGLFDSYKKSGIRGSPVSGIPEICYEFEIEQIQG